MLRGLVLAGLAAVLVAALPGDANAGRRRHVPAVLVPGWGYYSFPWGYVIPSAPYAYPVVYNCLRRYPVARPWGVGWRDTWAC